MIIQNVEARDHPVTLNQCEAVVEEGFEALFKVARALEIIEKMDLYQSEYESFEAYCKDRFKIKKEDAHSFMKLVHIS